ncbi:MAG: transglutaminase-like domain-containing protein [Lachnospiraceae bacterium]|nr:transglutaminase-like domain-containing protein [Lachnospiraceae bacterium]
MKKSTYTLVIVICFLLVFLYKMTHIAGKEPENDSNLKLSNVPENENYSSGDLVITTSSPNTDLDSTLPSPEVIPDILSPSISGKIIYYDDKKTAIIDASNTSHGYVSVCYNGSNPKVKVRIEANDNMYNYDLPSNGEYTVYPLQFGDGIYTISVFENASKNQYMTLFTQKITVKLEDENSVFLYPNQYVWFTKDSDVVYKSAQVCNGLTKDIDKVSAIFNYITQSVEYDYEKAENVKSGYLPQVDTILSTKKGICFDYAALFAAMCRVQGIPCKLITGYVSPDWLYHAWNEVYTEEKGWITASFYLEKEGYNTVDPTFYSNMSDSNKAAEYIGTGTNYQEYHIY